MTEVVSPLWLRINKCSSVNSPQWSYVGSLRKASLSRRGAVVARRFPKAKVASSTLVGGIPASGATLVGFIVVSGNGGGEFPGYTERSGVREGP